MTKRADGKRTQRVVVLMTPEELKAIEDWMFARRIKSVSDAVRRLSAAGMRHGGDVMPEDGNDD